MESALETSSVLFDARWIGIGGPGRVTQHMIEGLATIEPAGTWHVWGPDEVKRHLWAGAHHVESRHHPHGLFGQREFRGPPRGVRADVAFYPHQMRPLRKLAPIEVTTIHDTIPFRYPPNKTLAPLMKIYLQRVASLSEFVATDSEFSRRSITADLGVPAARLRVLPLSIDHEFARRVRARRAAGSCSTNALYMGADLPHKNLDRLVAAFARTTLQQRGGRLILVGMDRAGCDRLESLASSSGANVHVLGRVPDRDLEDLMVEAGLIVQPSLEEGFGLPVAEAMASGIPVAASSGGSLPEITRGAVEHFDPTDVDAIAHAIDDAATRVTQPDRSWPTPRELAEAVVEACADAVRAHRP